MKDRGAFLARRLRHNWELKAISLLMAVVSWYLIRDAIRFEVEMQDIRIDIQPREGLAILKQSASAADIVFRGAQEDLRRLDPRQIRVVVDLPMRDGGPIQEIAVTPDMVKGAHGVRPVSIAPRRLRIALDREAEKRVPVEGRTVGRPLSGRVTEVTCEPPVVTLHGPAVRLEATERVVTDPVDVDGRIESFARRVPVRLPGDDWVGRFAPREVQVRITIAGESAVRHFEDVPVTARVEPGRVGLLRLERASVRVAVTGAPNALERLTPADVRAFVDCAGLRPPVSATLPVLVHLSPGPDLTASPDPPALHVELEPARAAGAEAP